MKSINKALFTSSYLNRHSYKSERNMTAILEGKLSEREALMDLWPFFYQVVIRCCLFTSILVEFIRIVNYQ
jgi:hypothetical protein